MNTAMLAERQRLGRACAAARRQAGLQQQDLADLAQISVRTLGDIERGTGNPRLSSLLAVADTLGLNLNLGSAQNQRETT